MYYRGADRGNYSPVDRTRDSIKYIVVHYTAGNGDTARNNVDYFARACVKASAHYFVDDNEVCSSVPWNNVAWHCGGTLMNPNGGAFYGKVTNFNSIGVEMCSRKDAAGSYYFTNEVIDNAAQFVATLMQTYKIDIDHVVRHYDVNGKICPAPFIDESTWKAFKNLVMRKFDRLEGKNLYYENLEQIPEGYLRNTVAELIGKGIIKGNGNGLHLSEDMIRCIIFCQRLVEAN